MYAVIAIGGKQFKVQEGDVVAVERLAGEPGGKVVFQDVLAMGEGADLRVGTPKLEGAKAEAEILEHFRGPKLVVFKMKRRKGFRKRKGHRQELTKVRILSLA